MRTVILKGREVIPMVNANERKAIFNLKSKRKLSEPAFRELCNREIGKSFPMTPAEAEKIIRILQ